MAVAVKNNPEASSPSPFDRLPVACLVGIVYVLGSLGVLFKGLPHVWYNVLGFPSNSFLAVGLLLIVGVAAALGLVILGARLLGTQPAPGIRAGIFVGLGGILLIGLVTRWMGLLFESLI